MNKSRLTKFILILMAALLVCTSCRTVKTPSSAKSEPAASLSEYDGPYEVSYVFDGDTFAIKVEEKEIRIRVLGIDTPESVASEESGKENTEEGTIASDRAKELLEGSKVYLEYDKDLYDKYGRTLAYVYLEDGNMFEEMMISEGLAKVVWYEPNTKYTEYFKKLEKQAKTDKVGFWGTGYYN